VANIIALISINAKSIDLILPTYLERYRSGGKFSEKHKA
jgi:hypothetical protein